MASAPERPAGIAFGRFLVCPERRELLADGRSIKLGDRAFDVLTALIEARGKVVDKGQLMACVWPNLVVEENSLAAQIVALRRALGSERGLIRTVARRGYQFIGETRLPPGAMDEAPGGSTATVAVRRPKNLPEQVTELIGREKELQEILALLIAHRFVNLRGPGGIGKTRLALAAARQLLPEFSDGVWLAEFSALADPSLIPATVAAAVGLQFRAGEISPQVVAQALAHRRLLLILDTCEHVIDAAAAMAEALVQASPALRIIATSREPLRAEGEQIYQVPPLTLPAVEDHDPWRCGAVRLFMARSRAGGAHASEDHRIAPVIAGICRRLDGIPLAIELAAGRASTLGIETLASHLSDRFELLTGGRRTALPRHQTLRATLDWSYELLTEPERVILRRLAVFAGAFSLQAASAVVASSEIPPSKVVGRLSDLVTKSLVMAALEGTPERYQLLDTTRSYALEKLQESGEGESLLHHHAEYYRHLFEQAELEWETRSALEWLRDYGWCVDNLRAALDWAFSPEGDASTGVALTAAAVPLWMHLSLLDECHSRAEQAIAVLSGGESEGPRREMKLYAALAASSYGSSYLADGQAGAIWMKTLKSAESMGDVEYQLRSLWGLFASHVGIGDIHVSIGMVDKFRALAAHHRRRNDELIGERMMGLLRHLLGDQAIARQHIEHMLASFNLSNRRSHELIRFQFDQRTSALAYLARILWFQGFPNKAIRTAERAVDEARESNHPLSFCYTLAFAACPIMLWVEDLAVAERYIETLLDHSARHALSTWGAMGQTLRGVLRMRRGELDPELRQLGGRFDEWFSMMWRCELAAGLARAGQIADGLTTTEQAIERAEHTGARWLFPDLLRIKGELLLLQATTRAAASAEDHFQQALGWARRQGSLSLELRAATSLARLRRDRSRSADARAVLWPVYDRFTEGFDTADLKAAKSLLDEL